MNASIKFRRDIVAATLMLALIGSENANAKTGLKLDVGAARQIFFDKHSTAGVQWKSSAPEIAQVFSNGFVVGLKPGTVQVQAAESDSSELNVWSITVESASQSLQDPTSIKQYPNNRQFTVGTRKCYGSELNGQRASNPDERRFTKSNRIINPTPLVADKPLYWELRPDTKVYDGAGVFMGTVPSKFKFGDRSVPASMFNFGASKVFDGRICVYAFSVSIKPSPALAKLAEKNGGEVSTSAWLPLEDVVNKEALLERIGLGTGKLPALPLEATGFRVTGGDPKMYDTEFGEMSIVRDVASGPVPSHYLRRPSGTVNLIYSVPGFGLGGQGVDSFLVSDDLEFYPAQGAKVFKQPTYYPKKHPQAGKISPQTMTFLYGAIKSGHAEPVYGWMAREALAPAP